MRVKNTYMPAIDVVGGLWQGAVVWPDCFEGAEDKKFLTLDRPEWVVVKWNEYVPGYGISIDGGPVQSMGDGDWYQTRLVLPGPLGLCKEGLRRQISKRLGGGLMGSPVVLVLSGGHAFDGIRAAGLDLDENDVLPFLIALSTYMARLDRLCAAVDMKVTDGEIPQWYWDLDEAAWVLRVDLNPRIALTHSQLFSPTHTDIGCHIPGLKDGNALEALALCLDKWGQAGPGGK